MGTLRETNISHLKIDAWETIYFHVGFRPTFQVHLLFQGVRIFAHHLGPTRFPNRSSRPGWKHVSPLLMRDLLVWGRAAQFVKRNAFFRRFLTLVVRVIQCFWSLFDVVCLIPCIYWELKIHKFFCENMYKCRCESEHFSQTISDALDPKFQPHQLASFPQKLCKDTVAIALYPKKLLAHTNSRPTLPRDYPRHYVPIGMHGTNQTWWAKRIWPLGSFSFWKLGNANLHTIIWDHLPTILGIPFWLRYHHLKPHLNKVLFKNHKGVTPTFQAPES